MIAGEGIAGHLLGKCRFRFDVFPIKDFDVFPITGKVAARLQVPTCSDLVVAVTEIGDPAAVVVGGAKAAALLADTLCVKADVGEVIAAVGAALLQLPVDHAHGSHVRRGRPVAVVDDLALSADAAGIGIHGLCPLGHLGIGMVFGFSYRAEAGQLQLLHFLVGLLLRAGGSRLVIVQAHRPRKGIGAAAEVIAVGNAAMGRRETVDLRARHGAQGRGAVAAADSALIVAHKAGDHGAAADLPQLDAAEGVALADVAAARVHARQRAGVVAPGVGGVAGNAGNDGAASADRSFIVTRQTADIAGTSAVSVAGELVAGNGAVIDPAAVLTGQHADIHRSPLDAAAQFGGGGISQFLRCCHDDVLQRSRHKTEQADGGIVRFAGKGNTGDDMLAAVIAVLKGSGFRPTDGLLLRDRFPILAVVCPVIGCVINVALLPEYSLLGQNFPVFIIVFAQGVQMPRRANADLRGCLAAVRHGGAGEMGIVIIVFSIHRQLCVEALWHRFDILHQLCGQGQQIVVPRCTVLVSDADFLGVFRLQEMILFIHRHLHVFLRLDSVDYAVAVALHRFIGQGGDVGAEETVVVPAVPLVVHQRVVLKLRLPVAVMGQLLQSGIGILAQAQTAHQVIGMGIAVLLGEIGREQFYWVCGAQLLIVLSLTDGGVFILCFAEVVHVRYVIVSRSAACFACRSVCQAFSLQRRAGAVYISQYIAGQVAHHKARRFFSLQKSGSIAILDREVAGGDLSVADQAAGISVAKKIAVRIGAFNAEIPAAVADQATGIIPTPDDRGGQTFLDRQCISLCAAHQTAGHLAADPRVLRKYLLLGNVFVLDIFQVHLTAVDRCLAGQLSNQTANGSLTGDLGVDQPDVFQRAGEGLEQSRVPRCLNRQVVDRHPAGAFIAFELRVLNGRKFPGLVLKGPACAKGNIRLLHRGGDDLLLVIFLFQPGLFQLQILQMPPVFDDRRPVSPVFTNPREQAVDVVYRFTRVLDQRGVVSLCPDRHRQVFAGNQILKTILLAESLPLAEIIQRQRHRIGFSIYIYFVRGTRGSGGTFDLKFTGLIAGLVRHSGVKFQVDSSGAFALRHDLQLFPIDDLHREVQAVGIRRAHGVAAVIADFRAPLADAVGTGTQLVKIIRRAIHWLFAVKHGVHAAALGIVFHHPMTVPQLRLGLRLRVEPSGGLAAGGHIEQRSRLVRVLRVQAQFLNTLPAALIDVALARSLKPGHPVLHGGEDHLRPAVQFRLADVLLHFGNGDHGQGTQNDDDHDRHHHFQQ